MQRERARKRRGGNRAPRRRVAGRAAVGTSVRASTTDRQACRAAGEASISIGLAGRSASCWHLPQVAIDFAEPRVADMCRTCRACTRASRAAPVARRVPACAMSCRCPFWFTGFGLRRFAGVGHDRPAEGGQRIHAAARAIFVRRNLRVFPAALEKAHLFEPSERAVERAVGARAAASRRPRSGAWRFRSREIPCGAAA